MQLNIFAEFECSMSAEHRDPHLEHVVSSITAALGGAAWLGALSTLYFLGWFLWCTGLLSFCLKKKRRTFQILAHPF